MSAQSWVDRFQDPSRYDGLDLESPREYLAGDYFHTSRGRFNSRNYVRPIIPPLAPFNPDDSDLAMTEAPPQIVSPAIAPAINTDVTMHDVLGQPITYSNSVKVQFTPPLNYQHPARLSTLARSIHKPLRSSFRPQRALATHEQRLQWENILDAQKQIQASSPSDLLRAVAAENTLRNTPKKNTDVADLDVTETDNISTPVPMTPPAFHVSLPQNATVPPPTPPIKRSRDPGPEPDLEVIKPRTDLKPQGQLVLFEQPSSPQVEPEPIQEVAQSRTILKPKGQRTLFDKPSSPPRPKQSSLPGSFEQSSDTLVEPSPPRKRKMDHMQSSSDSPSGDAHNQQVVSANVQLPSDQLSITEMPVRQVNGMPVSLFSRASSFIQSWWRRLFGQTEYDEERVAVESPTNRHKRRAVSPSSRSSSPVLSSPPLVVTQPIEVIKAESSSQDEAPARDAPSELSHAPIPIIKTNKVRTVAAPREAPIIRDGKTMKQIHDDLTAEAKQRGVAISPNDPSRRRKPGPPRRPMPASTQAQISSRREERISQLIEISRNIISKQPARRPVKRGTSLKEKLRLAAEARKAAEAKKQEKEEAIWREQLEAEEKLNALDAVEAEAKRQAELKASIAITDPLIKPLSEHWTATIDKTLSINNPSRQVATLLDGNPLYKQDFDRVIAPGGSSSGTDSWLNDNAVNGWYKGIVEAKKDQIGWKKNSATPPPFAAMNTAWLNNVEAKGMKSIARWSKRMDCNGAKLLQCEKIFFPINGGSHWTLLVINPQDHAIEYLDSLGGKGSRYLRHARDWLAMELGSAYHADDWSEIIDRSSRQGNMDDCGVFTCLNGLASAKGRDFTEITHARMPLARRMIAAVLLNGGFTGELQL